MCFTYADRPTISVNVCRRINVFTRHFKVPSKSGHRLYYGRSVRRHARANRARDPSCDWHQMEEMESEKEDEDTFCICSSKCWNEASDVVSCFSSVLVILGKHGEGLCNLPVSGCVSFMFSCVWRERAFWLLSTAYQISHKRYMHDLCEVWKYLPSGSMTANFFGNITVYANNEAIISSIKTYHLIF